MKQHLSKIQESSRALLVEQALSAPIRGLATAVLQGANLIDLHFLDEQFDLPQFDRAVFHLCHLVGQPLCGKNNCNAFPLRECACIKGSSNSEEGQHADLSA